MKSEDLDGDSPLDQRNADFWDELCGTGLAQAVGATGRTPGDLARFDAAYLDFYPYLTGYLPHGNLQGQRVLEIGLGYGTLGQMLVELGADYVGVDVSPGPVEMMRYRLSVSGRGIGGAALRGSALALPMETGSIDFVYSIGCLHHTGDLRLAVSEVRRVLRDGGRAIVMLYNRRSLRQFALLTKRMIAKRRRVTSSGKAEEARAAYDSDSEGRAAPHTDFVSVGQVRDLFRDFRSVTVDRRNLTSGRISVPRPLLLATRIDRLGGLDLYVRARA